MSARRKVTIESVRVLVVDDESPDVSYLDQSEPGCDFSDRKAAYERGEFHFVGIVAEATIVIPMGAASVLQTVRSPGLWGIESDSDRDHVRGVAEEEIGVLSTMLAALGVNVRPMRGPAFVRGVIDAVDWQ